MIGDPAEIFNDYSDPAQPFTKHALPALAEIPARKLAEAARVSEREITRIRKRKSPPGPELRRTLARIAVNTALDHFRTEGIYPEWTEDQHGTIAHKEWLDVLAAYNHVKPPRTCTAARCTNPVHPGRRFCSDACRKWARRNTTVREQGERFTSTPYIKGHPQKM
jgi:hypothetical protein